MATDGSIQVSVAWSPAARQVHEHALCLPAGSTAWQALQACALAVGDAALARHSGGLGVWGRRIEAGTVLADGDRLELYRPLRVDPKQARRARFADQGARAAGLFARRRAGAKAGY